MPPWLALLISIVVFFILPATVIVLHTLSARLETVAKSLATPVKPAKSGARRRPLRCASTHATSPYKSPFEVWRMLVRKVLCSALPGSAVSDFVRDVVTSSLCRTLSLFVSVTASQGSKSPFPRLASSISLQLDVTKGRACSLCAAGMTQSWGSSGCLAASGDISERSSGGSKGGSKRHGLWSRLASLDDDIDSHLLTTAVAVSVNVLAGSNKRSGDLSAGKGSKSPANVGGGTNSPIREAGGMLTRRGERPLENSCPFFRRGPLRPPSCLSVCCACVQL